MHKKALNKLIGNLAMTKLYATLINCKVLQLLKHADWFSWLFTLYDFSNYVRRMETRI